MRTARILTILALLVSSPACFAVIDGGATLTVENRSSFPLFELYLTPTGSRLWGRDLLRGDPLFPGERINVYDIDCNYYDVMVVDQYGLECILPQIDLCGDARLWRVTNETLAICDRFGSV